jgi:hypothetical protein
MKQRSEMAVRYLAEIETRAAECYDRRLNTHCGLGLLFLVAEHTPGGPDCL